MNCIHKVCLHLHSITTCSVFKTFVTITNECQTNLYTSWVISSRISAIRVTALDVWRRLEGADKWFIFHKNNIWLLNYSLLPFSFAELEYRLDYQLRDSGGITRGYISMVTSHTSYWTNRDIACFLLTHLHPVLQDYWIQIW